MVNDTSTLTIFGGHDAIISASCSKTPNVKFTLLFLGLRPLWTKINLTEKLLKFTLLFLGLRPLWTKINLTEKLCITKTVSLQIRKHQSTNKIQEQKKKKKKQDERKKLKTWYLYSFYCHKCRWMDARTHTHQQKNFFF